MGLEYKVNISATDFLDGTDLLAPLAAFFPLGDIPLEGTLLVESVLAASNLNETDPNNFEVGLFADDVFVSGSDIFPSGVLGFATNTLMDVYSGGDPSGVGLDLVEQSFDPASREWTFVLGNDDLVLDAYDIIGDLVGVPEPVVGGEVTLRFSPDLRSVEGEASLLTGPSLDQATAAYSTGFNGTLEQVYEGFAESSAFSNGLLEQIGFDAAAYLNANGDLLEAFGNDLAAAQQHYLQYGLEEGRVLVSLADFDPSTYLASYDDLLNAFGNNLDAAQQHYIEFGAAEGRSIFFEADDYIASYGDLIETFGYSLTDAVSHYISFGAAEGRSRDAFNEANYLNKYGDLQAAFGSDLSAATQHYINFGYAEGRSDL